MSPEHIGLRCGGAGLVGVRARAGSLHCFPAGGKECERCRGGRKGGALCQPCLSPGFLTGSCLSSAPCFGQHRRSISDELPRVRCAGRARLPGTCACRRKHASAPRFLFQLLLNFRKKKKKGNKSSRTELKSAGEGQTQGS